MVKIRLKGFKAVIDRLTPTGTFEEIPEGTGSYDSENHQDTPGTVQTILKGTGIDSDKAFIVVSGDGVHIPVIKGGHKPIRFNGHSIPISDNERVPDGISDDELISDDDVDHIKCDIRDLVDRIIVTINSSKRILDRSTRHKTIIEVNIG